MEAPTRLSLVSTAMCAAGRDNVCVCGRTHIHAHCVHSVHVRVQEMAPWQGAVLAALSREARARVTICRVENAFKAQHQSRACGPCTGQPEALGIPANATREVAARGICVQCQSVPERNQHERR